MSQKNMGRLAQDMKREVIAIIRTAEGQPPPGGQSADKSPVWM